MNDKYLDDAKKCCDKALGYWESSEMCREMEDNNQWDAPSARRRRLGLDAPDAPQARLYKERRHGIQDGLGPAGHQLHQEEQQVFL